MTESRILPYAQAEQLLRRYEVPLAPAQLVQSPPEAADAARALGFPVALKAISAQATHKSDAGLLRLQLDDAGAVAAAAAELLEASRALGLGLEGLLVQVMAAQAVEMIAGIAWDEQFGPVLALGSGGILVELVDDAVLRLPPLTAAHARRMAAQTRSWPLLQGYRGRPAGDVAALAQLMVNLSHLAQGEAARLLSVDLNPVIVLPEGQGVQVVDVRVAVRVAGRVALRAADEQYERNEP